MTSRECPEETFKWISEVYQYCDPAEYAIIRAVIFAYHCTRLCSHIRGLIDASDLNELLSSSPTILRDIDRVEQITHPLSHKNTITSFVIEPPLRPYGIPDCMHLRHMGVDAYQATFRMRVSYDLLQFLFHASKAPTCTPQQRELFTRLRHRSIEEFRTIANKTLIIVTTFFGMDSLTPLDQLGRRKDDIKISRTVGWSDVIRILWPLRMITECPISLEWQRDAANKICDLINKQLEIE